MTIKVGDAVPSATLIKATEAGPQPISTEALFAGRTVALFSVPGAFTPTCSAKHLPGYITQRRGDDGGGRRRDRLRLGQRRLRHGRVGPERRARRAR